MFNNDREVFSNNEQSAEAEESFEGAASRKKMSMFDEFFAKHPNLKKAANTATLLLILTKGLLVIDGAQAAENQHYSDISSPTTLEFIDDVKNGASDFEKIPLPEGVKLVFKDNLSSSDGKASHEEAGSLGDSGENLFISSYAGSAKEALGNDIHKRIDVVSVIGEFDGQLEPGAHAENIHGYADTKAGAIANALSHFSSSQLVHVDGHTYSSDSEKDHYHGNKLVSSSVEHQFMKLVETKTSSYISSYEVVESEEDSDGLVKVTVNVVGGLLEKAVANANE